jgi:hypothetical protein
MRCPACGVEMHLIKVVPDEAMMVPGYEEHTFECSGCHDHVRRLVFIPRAIGPLVSERMRLPPAGPKTQNKDMTAKGAWARAVRAVPPIKAMYVVGTLTMIALAGLMITWGQSLKGPMGDQGPAGPKGPQGDAGPPSPASGIRIVHSNCDETTCLVQCGENEMLLTAYCGPIETPPSFQPSEPQAAAAPCRRTIHLLRCARR